MQDKTQADINIWESQNKDRIIKWEKDFENQTIEFTLSDKSTMKFKIIEIA